MIKLFSGTDSYESYNLAKKQSNKLAKDSNQEVKILNANEIENPAEFIQYIEGVGMFAGSYIVFVKRLSSNKRLLEYFSDNYDALNKYDIVLWEDSKPDGRLKFFQTLNKAKASFNFELPKRINSDTRAWLKTEMKSRNVKFTDSQFENFLGNLGQDKWRLINELEKISLFLSSAKKETLSEDEFNKIIGFEVSGDIWELVDAFGNRKAKKCLQEYHKISTYEENGQYIIAMLERELSNIALLHFARRDGINENELSINPFVLQKLKQKFRNFSMPDVLKYLKKLFDLDRSIKNGDIDEKVGLSLYILSI